MINVDPAFSVNAFGQLVFFGCELMPEPSAPKRPGYKKKSANLCSRSDRGSFVSQLRAGSGAAHVLADQLVDVGV